MIQLTAKLIENFSGAFLSPRFDNPSPTAPFHRQCWDLYCSSQELVAVAAPRQHAKSTALTYIYILAVVLFRTESHVMLIGSSEELAMNQLMDITKELKENDDLRAEFGIQKFLVDAKGEIIVKCDDGHEFRILARGVEQRVRGIKWNGRRPGLIVCDDCEEDEQVENPTRRRKLSRWFNRALIPMGRKGCKVRVHGTILHVDSLLARMMKSKIWKSLFFRAHKSFDDFSEILWPVMFTEERLRAIRQVFIEDQDANGYSQEYLNDPLDDGVAYIKKSWMLPIPLDELEDPPPRMMGVGVDFAISKADSANRTSFTIGGKTPLNQIDVVDQEVGRLDSEEIIETFFDLQSRHHPEFFFVESGQIWLALKPTLTKEMLRRDVFINYIERTPIKDKAARGRAFQKRCRAGGMRFDKTAAWYPGYEEEVLRFTEVAEATLDDQFDSTANLVLGFEHLPDVEEEDFEPEEEQFFRRNDPRRNQGRNQTTGY